MPIPWPISEDWMAVDVTVLQSSQVHTRLPVMLRAVLKVEATGSSSELSSSRRRCWKNSKGSHCLLFHMSTWNSASGKPASRLFSNACSLFGRALPSSLAFAAVSCGRAVLTASYRSLACVSGPVTPLRPFPCQ